MADKRKIMIKNGDALVSFYIYKCQCCDKDVEECEPHTIENDICHCWDCSFKLGIISEKEFLECIPIKLNGMKATVKDGEIYVTTGKFPWEITSRDRNYSSYKEWREEVFKRDKYTCQHCKQIGGVLNAHHIKEYAKYPELRTVLENGITLCEKCHKKIHRKAVV